MKFKRSISLFLVCIMTFSFCLYYPKSTDLQNIYAVTFEEANRDSVFLKQQGKYTCNLCASAMLMRRVALYRGDSNWYEITESALMPTAWYSGGLYNSFSYNNINVTSTYVSRGDKDILIRMLSQHPEGIVVYNYDYPHAILLTDYTNGVFFCADPANGAPSGRIPVSQAIISVDKIDEVWYCSNPNFDIYSDDMNVPTFTLDKSEYHVGDTVNIVWQESSPKSNLDHYWLSVYCPNSDNDIQNRIDPPASTTSFIVSEEGEYTITMWSTPKGSEHGEGSLTDTKIIKVAQPEPVFTPRPGSLIVTPDSKTGKTTYEWDRTIDAAKVSIALNNDDIKEYAIDAEFPKRPNVVSTDSETLNKAVLSYYDKNGNKMYNDIVYFSADEKDVWSYCSKLPDSAADLRVEYQQSTSKVAVTSPGSKWIKGDLVKSQYENSGDPYESNIELPTSETRELVSYFYYHFCSGSTGDEVNYEQTSTFVHYDAFSVEYSMQSFAIVNSGLNTADTRYKWYQLNWPDSGYRATCKDGVTCDGSYGEHGYRSNYWYRCSRYQDKKLVNYYEYFAPSNVWSEEKNAYASCYRFIRDSSTIKGDCNNDGEFSVADVVLLQKWLLATPDVELNNWKAADLCDDGRLDVFDLCLMKRMLVENS